MALGLAAAGGALTAVVFLASSAVRPRQALTWLGRAVVPPESRPARAVWCLAALVVGTLVMLDAPAVLRFVLTGAGGALVLVALTKAVRLIAPGPTEMPRRAARRRPRRVSRSWWRPAAAAAVAVAVVAGATLLVLRSGAGASPTGADDPRCNGSVLLCDRRLDEVVVPATHNSNASAADGYLFANQPRGILPQLDAGYRGLLIDVYFGLPVPGRSVVLTDRAPLTAQQRAEQVAELGQAAVAAAEQIHARASQAGAVRSTYLCHGFCELGATPLEPELAKIRDWLQAHPREVLVLFVQDEIPAEPIVRAFQSSGLDRFAAALDLGKPLPTLGQMVASNRRLVVMAENQAGVAPWYLDGFAFTQETPYSARSEADFSCRPNRGRADSPLLLVNNFVTPASVRAAARANSREVLQPRLTECQRQRDRLPNLVAVDFYDTGDVLGVVRTANGLTGAP